jgi:hypothetical protein
MMLTVLEKVAGEPKVELSKAAHHGFDMTATRAFGE